MSMSPQLTAIGFVIANVHPLVMKFLSLSLDANRTLEQFIVNNIHIIWYMYTVQCSYAASR